MYFKNFSPFYPIWKHIFSAGKVRKLKSDIRENSLNYSYHPEVNDWIKKLFRTFFFAPFIIELYE